MINIQIFGGPGTGKSTTCAGLFYMMKQTNYIVEYITEYAKELTYSDDYSKLNDQLFILAEQHHRLKRLENKVEYVIHDSPFIMGLSYLKEDEHLPKLIFDELITTMYKSYNNINIFLKRDDNLLFQNYGRSQTLSESLKKDKEIMQLLDDRNIPYMIVDVNNAVEDILQIIENHK